MNPINEGRFIDVKGVEQWVAIRGTDRANPALLILGGPGMAFSAFAPLYAPWEERFTLVYWDPPGAGSTHARHRDGDAGPLTMDRLVADGVTVTEHVLEHLGQRKLTLLAFSAGTIVGLGMIRQAPERFAAYVGSGQIVDWARQDALSYGLLLDRARGADDADMLADLERIGPPPYAYTATDAVKSKYAGAMTASEQAAAAAVDPAIWAAVQDPPPDAGYVAQNLVRDNPYERAMAAYDALRDEIVGFDARALGVRFDVPMYFLQGTEDVFTVSAEVERYAEEIQAPRKRFVPIEGAGHSTFVMRDELLRLLTQHVLASV